MPAFIPSPRRRNPRHGRPAITGAVLAASLGALLAACSLIAPQTPAPAESLTAATAAPSPTPSVTATAPATPVPSPTLPASGPPPAAGTWRTVVKALAAPGAWLDFGFTAKGDIVAIGTHDATADPLHLFVARFTATGRKRDEHALARTLSPIGGDWAAVNPTDGSILIVDYNGVSALFALRRFSSTTGANLSNVYTDSGINRVAIDARGRVFGLPQYGVGTNAYAAIVRLDARSRVRSGVDFWLRPLDAGRRPETSGILGFPTAITVGRNGRVIVVDEPDVSMTYADGSPRRSSVVTSLSPSLGSPRQFELPVEWHFGSQAFATWIRRIAVAGGPDGSVYVGEPIVGDDEKSITGWQVREFDSSGRLVGTWGQGAPWSGVLQPSHPAVDAAGNLWVIETDPATGSSVIAALSLPA